MTILYNTFTKTKIKLLDSANVALEDLQFEDETVLTADIKSIQFVGNNSVTRNNIEVVRTAYVGDLQILDNEENDQDFVITVDSNGMLIMELTKTYEE